MSIPDTVPRREAEPVISKHALFELLEAAIAQLGGMGKPLQDFLSELGDTIEQNFDSWSQEQKEQAAEAVVKVIRIIEESREKISTIIAADISGPFKEIQERLPFLKRQERKNVTPERDDLLKSLAAMLGAMEHLPLNAAELLEAMRLNILAKFMALSTDQKAAVAIEIEMAEKVVRDLQGQTRDEAVPLLREVLNRINRI